MEPYPRRGRKSGKALWAGSKLAPLFLKPGHHENGREPYPRREVEGWRGAVGGQQSGAAFFEAGASRKR